MQREHAHSIYSLWGDALARDPARGMEAAYQVYKAGVKAGLYMHASQRPARLIRSLRAAPWHDPYAHEACRALRDAYPTIRAEAYALLQADDRRQAETSGQIFEPYSSKALHTGEWSDVGLFFNGRINKLASQRAPRTTELLRSAVGNLNRDAVSCPLGSAYFSLLRPHTQLKAHCGPTNARLRAHLGLIVPPGDCCIRCGDEPARRWKEGEVLLFDDSFEHEVWNNTEEPRLVLIVDLWHDQLVTDADRAHACDEPSQIERYKRALRGEYEVTTLRGH